MAESLYFTAHLRGLSRRDAEADRDRLLEQWDLGALRNKSSMRLSGGQKRLMQRPWLWQARHAVLILDEPTNELAPQRRRHVWETLREHNRVHGATIIFITHDAIEAEKIIQRVGILRDGRLVALGRPSDLKRQIDQQLRLEIFFASTPPALPDGLTPQQLDVGRWLVYPERRQVDGVLKRAQSRSDR
ncbi:MAG: AAA family ATPase [Caldilineaceae bacterium]